MFRWLKVLRVAGSEPIALSVEASRWHTSPLQSGVGHRPMISIPVGSSAMKICCIKRNNARVRAMAVHGWKAATGLSQEVSGAGDDEVPGEDAAPVDLERLARDRIAKVISRSFRGHDLARLVDEVLQGRGRPPTGAPRARTRASTSWLLLAYAQITESCAVLLSKSGIASLRLAAQRLGMDRR